LLDTTFSFSDYTPLHHAVNWGCLSIVENLIEKGADVNAKASFLSLKIIIQGAP
jgi:ankyrin repeat protein